MTEPENTADAVAREHRVMVHTAQELVCLCGESFSVSNMLGTVFRRVTVLYAAHLKEEGLRARLAAAERAEVDETGLDPEGRYHVRKIHDPEGEHAECRYFVLDPQHDPFARGALRHYAALASATHPGLTRDLDQWLIEVEAPRGDNDDA